MLKRLKRLQRDRGLVTVLTQGLVVLAGKFGSKLSGLVALAILTRTLGAEAFGVFALVRATVSLCDHLVNFQSWQAVIKFGAEAIEEERPADVRRLLKLALTLDSATAVLGAGVAAAVGFVAAQLFGWGPLESKLCALYGLVILSHLSGVPDGVFRLFDLYKVPAFIQNVTGAVLAGSVALGAFLGFGLTEFLVTYLVVEVAGNLAILILALREIDKRGYGSFLRADLTGMTERFPGIKRFVIATNLQSSLKKGQGELDMMVVGALTSPAAVGLYKAARQLGVIPRNVFNAFTVVIYSELSKLAAKRDRAAFARLLLRVSAVSLLGTLTFTAIGWFFSEDILRVVSGPDFVSAASVLSCFLLASVPGNLLAIRRRALVALGRPMTLLGLSVANTVVLVGLLYFFTSRYAIVGAAIAFVVHRFYVLALVSYFVRRAIKGLVPRDHEPEAAAAPLHAP